MYDAQRQGRLSFYMVDEQSKQDLLYDWILTLLRSQRAKKELLSDQLPH